MDLGRILNDALKLADSVNEYLPGAGASQLGIELGKKVLGIIDDLKEEIPLDQQGAVQERRQRLATLVEAKAKEESRKLRG